MREIAHTPWRQGVDISVPHVDVQDIVPPCPGQKEIAEVIDVTRKIQQVRERIAKLTVDTAVPLDKAALDQAERVLLCCRFFGRICEQIVNVASLGR